MSLFVFLDTAMQVVNGRVNNGAETRSRSGMVLPFKPLSLAFNHMNYYVDMPAVSVQIGELCLSLRF